MAGGEGKSRTGKPEGGGRDFPIGDDYNPESGEAQRNEASYQEGYRQGQGSGSSSTATVRPTGSTKTIVAMMAFATVFSVVGAEIRAAKSTQAVPTRLGHALSDPFIIILGGTTGAALLTLLALAGDTGRTFATGLAGLTLVTALFVNGGPVWDALRHVTGSQPTAPLGRTTATGSAISTTTPTGATS